MLPMSRLLRKTKAVTSPGKKPNETREEYRLRYMVWWISNNVDKLSVADNIGALQTVSTETYEKELASEVTSSNNLVLDATPSGSLTPEQLKDLQQADWEMHTKEMHPKKLGAGSCGTRINLGRRERQVNKDANLDK